MEITLHEVNRIEVSEIDKQESYTARRIYIETKDGEKLIVACFGDTKKDLEGIKNNKSK